MQIQSYLYQLGAKDQEDIAKTLGCSDDDTKEKNTKEKELVRLTEEQRGKFLKKLWCCVGGKYNEIIGFYQLG